MVNPIPLRQRNWLRHALFWVGVLVFLLFSSSIQPLYPARVEGHLLTLCLQLIFAYTLTFWLAPQYLAPARYPAFVLGVSLVLLVLVIVYTLTRKFYLEPKYLSYFQQTTLHYQPIQVGRWLTDPHVLVGKSVMFGIPGCLLLMMEYYQKQKHWAQLNEQKKAAELNALKNQLNPHFLFNTLNNLYSLTLLKSDKAPEVLAQLSEMLDYMLYQTQAPLVALDREITLLENYIALEKVRYGDRVQVLWNLEVAEPVKVAPLILLTFLENAFKHGVKEETQQATIRIAMHTNASQLVIRMENSLPLHRASTSSAQSLGLDNVQQQLELLYAGAYEYQGWTQDSHYFMELKIPKR
ncbi:MAG: histidine kinase [Bacteroidota bacterium]